ncbi:MAG: 50S ribosomal protein L15 [Clostridia bacterium]|nr:50S ribosomal protein L15 [Clostridia bacterium]
MKLGLLKPAEGSRTSKKRLGRGIGSGLGKTSTKGHKGQWARSGGGVRPGFEGGQMPLTRRVPKRGFKNHFRKEYAIINVCDLEALEIAAGSVVNYEMLLLAGYIKEVKGAEGLKVLGSGTLTKALTVEAAKFSATAKAAIENAGGTCTVVEG